MAAFRKQLSPNNIFMCDLRSPSAASNPCKLEAKHLKRKLESNKVSELAMKKRRRKGKKQGGKKGLLCSMEGGNPLQNGEGALGS